MQIFAVSFSSIRFNHVTYGKQYAAICLELSQNEPCFLFSLFRQHGEIFPGEKIDRSGCQYMK
jgi:hypothetical protein